MSGALALLGTTEPCARRRAFTAGPVSFTLEAGALRHITIDGTEAIRAIAFLVRDRDWGTLEPRLTRERITQEDGRLHISFRAAYSSGGAQLVADIDIQAGPSGLRMSAAAKATGAFETNRAGFTVLHPIDGVAGCPAIVAHSGKGETRSHFPYLIAPWQPFMDIAALTHQAGAQAVTCRFEGDTFEMEDQRQWGDASFKTYNRPLAQPWPYTVQDGAPLCQSVALTWAPASGSAVAAIPERSPEASPEAVPAPHAATFPQMALALEPRDARRLAAAPADLAHVAPQRLLCHLDATLGAVPEQLSAFAAAQRACPAPAYDLELICAFTAQDPAPELQDLAAQMAASGFAPASVMVCPSVDRQSTPPGSSWPDCPPLAQIHTAAAQAFAGLPCGGGMASFFPELNRKRPPADMLDFVSHGLCPIIHAADDVSVMETLQAVPHITRSARAIAAGRPYRIGPASIAMRQNPYGSRVIPNPKGGRVCMAGNDPRHFALFGAAYAAGLAAALAPSGVSVWTPAALYGPRGVVGEDGIWPITQVLAQLSALAGQRVHSARAQDGAAHLAAGRSRMAVNLTAQPKDGLGPYEVSFTASPEA